MRRGPRVLQALMLALAMCVGGVGIAQSQRVLAAPRALTNAPVPVTSTTPFNNEGVSFDANPSVGNFDGGGNSYSADTLAAAGFASGASVTLHGYTFQWITAAAGSADNWQADGQAIPVNTVAGNIALLGASASGPATGSGFIRYTDGSTSPFTLTFSDWTLNGGGGALDPSNVIALTAPYRNTPTGRETTNTYVFMTTIALTASKTAASINLPDWVNQGALHVFAIGVVSGSSTYTRKGITNDSNTSQGNFDGGGRSYSNNALDAAGLGSGLITSVYNFNAQWPVVAPGVNDTWQVPGTVIPLHGSGSTLEILGAAVGGVSSGTATISYIDGTTQPFMLALSDWTLGGGGQQPLNVNQVVARMPYRNTSTGPENVTTYVFATYVGLWQGKSLQSLTLPTTESGGQLVVLAAAAGAASIPYNLTAISPNSAPTSANFDGVGGSYSNNALAAAGLTSGSKVTVNGLAFQWPGDAASNPDAWRAAGQVIPVIGKGNILGFLGAAAGGPTSGIVTITYTDGSTQSNTLKLSDWTLGNGSQSPLSQDKIAASMSYHNTPGGSVQVTTYVFFTSVKLNSQLTVQSVTLPSQLSGGSLNVFAVSLQPAKGSSQTQSGWTTYLGSVGHPSYNGAETTLTAANASQLALKWTAHGAQGISAQPIVANGMTYWGSWDGLMHATNSSGIDAWTVNLGQTSIATCVPPTIGVAGTPALGMIGSTRVMYVAGGNRTMYALNLSNGAVVWSTTLEVSTAYFVWDSPALYNGSVYIGISSFGDCPRASGKIYKLDAATGALQDTVILASDVCPGDGVWGSPTIDTATGVIYFATGNGCVSDPNSSAIEAISAGDLSLVDRWQVPAAQLVLDSDFGSTPTLFTATINGVTRQLIGVPNKNGTYYAFDRTNLSGGPVWSVGIAVGGECPDCGDGSISPSAWDGTTLYVAGGSTTVGGIACAGSVRAVNPATGTYLWERCLTTGPVLGAVSASPGLVVVGTPSTLYVLNAGSGVPLFHYTDPGTYSFFFSAPTVFGGMIYAPNVDGAFYAFGL
jgi:outer membrane protein assembly factor BamB